MRPAEVDRGLFPESEVLFRERRAPKQERVVRRSLETAHELGVGLREVPRHAAAVGGHGVVHVGQIRRQRHRPLGGFFAAFASRGANVPLTNISEQAADGEAAPHAAPAERVTASRRRRRSSPSRQRSTSCRSLSGVASGNALLDTEDRQPQLRLAPCDAMVEELVRTRKRQGGSSQ